METNALSNKHVMFRPITVQEHSSPWDGVK
jgi:hypothetical protein